MNRRQFLGTAAMAAPAAAAAPDFTTTRDDFPRALNETYFNSAAQHPLGNHTVAAMQRYLDYLHKGPGEGRVDFWETGLREVKPMFARLIGAKPSEIAYCGSTTIGENIVVNGLDLRGGNVVTNDLHYSASLANYLTRSARGLDVRIVKHRDWHIDLADVEKAVNRKTKLIAVSWISSVNGHAENLKALSDLAHSHGAYLYADIIQGAGAVPLDVHAAGVDFASCAMYKWLQGEHGFGFLYIREGLAEQVVRTREFTGHPDHNYTPWTAAPKRDAPDFINRAPSGIGAFEVGTPSVITYAGQYASLQYMEKLGVPNIHAHAAALLARLRKGLSGLGFTPITPDPAPAGILTVLCQDAASVRSRILAAVQAGRIRMLLSGPNSALTLGRFGNHMRFSVSVFNNQQDIDRFLAVVS
jgi:selenocysteine lyase/cysteine desulfurase